MKFSEARLIYEALAEKEERLRSDFEYYKNRYEKHNDETDYTTAERCNNKRADILQLMRQFDDSQMYLVRKVEK